jgi:Asp/Glu/hydantoin racemase
VSPKRILLVNPNISGSVTTILAREAQMVAGQRAEILAVSPFFGSASIECVAEIAIAAHGVLETIAAHPGYDAAIIAAFGDPGLEAAREIARMPVFGLGESGIRAAVAHGRRFAIITIGPQLRSIIERMAGTHGASGRLVALRFLGVNVLDAARDRAALEHAVFDAVHECVSQDGAEAVLLGGAPFAGVGRALTRRGTVPIYDGLETAIELAVAASRLDIAEAVQPPSTKERRGVSIALARKIDAFLTARTWSK